MKVKVKVLGYCVYCDNHKIGEFREEFDPYESAEKQVFEIKPEDCVHPIKYGYCDKAIIALNEKLEEEGI